MNTTDRAARAADLRSALVAMTIRYGSSVQKMTYADEAGRLVAAARLQRAERRQFAAIKRLADALADLAGGAR